MFFSIVSRITNFTCLRGAYLQLTRNVHQTFFVSGISRWTQGVRSGARVHQWTFLDGWESLLNFLPITAPESIINPSAEMCWTRTAKPSNVKDKRNLWYFGSVFYSSRKLKLLSLIILFSFIPLLSVKFETFGTFTHTKNRKERIKEGTNAFPDDPRGSNIV